MTDLIAAPNADTAATEAITDALPPDDGGRPVEWAPREPAPKKRRTGLWVGLGLGILAVGAAAASTILIAPGTTVAGIPVGGLTAGAAADVIGTQLAGTEVTLTGVDGDVVLTGADLGASIDAKMLADEAFASHPMWNLGSWMPEPIPAVITLDPQTAESALRAAVPASYEDAVNASVAFDEATAAYVPVEAQSGTGINVDDLTAAITSALSDGDHTVSFSGAPTEAAAAISDEDATRMSTELNEMLATIGFYVGTERTVPITPAVAATWLSVVDADDELLIAADAAAIQATVETLPPLVNRAPVNAQAIVDSGGEVLQELTAGVNGRTLGDTTGVASDFAEQLELGEPAFEMDVSEVAFESTTLPRRIEVDLGDQRTYLFENDQVVNSWAISSGTSATPSATGHFRVYAHVRIQDMRGSNSDGSAYVTEDVPWVTYYNGDEAFHGTYWHSNFGTPMSHGCLNMTFGAAQTLYEWSPLGLEVWVHD